MPQSDHPVWSMFQGAPVPTYRGWRFRVWWTLRKLRNRVIRRYCRDWERIAIETQNQLVHAEGAAHEYLKGLHAQERELHRLHAQLGLCVGEAR